VGSRHSRDSGSTSAGDASSKASGRIATMGDRTASSVSTGEEMTAQGMAAPSGHMEVVLPTVAVYGGKRSGRRASTTVNSAPIDSISNQPRPTKVTSKTSIPYPATPSTVASSDSYSTANRTAAAPSHGSELNSAASSSTSPSLARTLGRASTSRAHRRSSASNANGDSQSVRSSLSRLHRNHHPHQRRMSTSAAGAMTSPAGATRRPSLSYHQSSAGSSSASVAATAPPVGASTVQW
jgi:hypothetical protein